VGDGWFPAEPAGFVLDPGAARTLPALYWLEARERVGDVLRFGPWAVSATASRFGWRILANPSRGESAFLWDRDLPAGVELEIFDVRGGLVRSVSLDPAAGSYKWDGMDGGGRPASPGVYFARIRGSDLPPLRLVRLP
jgi:hypothetical protein